MPSLVWPRNNNGGHNNRIAATTTVAVTTAAAAVMAVVLVSTRYYLRAARRTSQAVNDNKEMILPLLHMETSTTMFQTVQAISTLTWYEYQGGGRSKVEAYLRDRMKQILQANPWLTGRLVQTTTARRGSSSEGSIISIVYSKDAEGGDATIVDHFQIIPPESTTISRETTPYNQLSSLLQGMDCLVGTGMDILKKKSCFFRVSLVPDAKEPNQRFALIVSLAHCVGDGHTFYKLHNMLDEKADILVLRAIRKPVVIDRITDALGGPVQAGSLTEPPIGFLMRFIKGMLYSTLFGPPTCVKLHWVDEEWIQKEKKKLAVDEESNLKFVSTNDIVTCRFFQIAKVDQGIMAMNFRGKIQDCNETDAGNYFNYLICRPEDYQSPAQIRMAVQDIYGGNRRRRQATTSSSPMTSWQHMTSQSLFGATSNWATFYKPVHLENCQQDVHIPVIPCDSLSVPSRFVTGLFLFQPTVVVTTGDDGKQQKKRIAAMFAGHPKVLAALQTSGMLGPEVYK